MSDLPQYETLSYEPGPITVITHDDQATRNALTGHFILEFKDALNRFQRDSSCLVAVVLATGDVFSSGHNLGYVGNLLGDEDEKGGEDKAKRRSSVVRAEEDWRDQMNFMRDNLYYPLWDCRKPIVMGVQGSAHAGGSEFAMMGDIVVASSEAVFDYAILRVSGAITNQSLIHLVGYHRAMEIYLCGWNFTAAKAAEWGAVNSVVEPDKVVDEAMRYAEMISLMPPEAIRLQKEAAKMFMNRMGARELIWYACETDIMVHLTHSTYSEDGRETQFYDLLRSEGLRAALDWRDEPFRKFGYERR